MLNLYATDRDRIRRARAMIRLAERELDKMAEADEAEAHFERAMGVPSEIYSSPGYLRYKRERERELSAWEERRLFAALAVERLTGEEVLERCPEHGLDEMACQPGVCFDPEF